MCGGKSPHFRLHDPGLELLRKVAGLELFPLALRHQARLDRLGSRHAGCQLFKVETVAAQIDLQQRLPLRNGLAFADMNCGDDTSFQVLYGLHAIGRNDLAAGDHHVFHGIEKTYEHQDGKGSHDQIAFAGCLGAIRLSLRYGGLCIGGFSRSGLAQHQGQIVFASGPHDASSCTWELSCSVVPAPVSAGEGAGSRGVPNSSGSSCLGEPCSTLPSPRTW